MPTYDYVCSACGHEFEHFQSMTSRLLKTCPKCAKKTLVRKVGAGAGVIFKGSGFYETDYKRAPAPSGAGSTSKTDPKDSKTSDAPPATGCGKDACATTPGTCAPKVDGGASKKNGKP